jgi:hypothetical protein
MTATPAGVTITASTPDGETRDVTEGVQVLYDLVIQSMDWGSRFLSVEDVEPILAIARFCGFKDFEEAERYVDAQRVAEKRRKCKHPEWRELPPDERGAVWRECTTCGLPVLVRTREP